MKAGEDKKKAVTLEDVARYARVSLSTASAAINGKAIVRASTRERVARAARELGYRKDASASVLAGRNRRAKAKVRQLTLGYVISPGQTSWKRQSEIFAVEAQRLGYDMMDIRLNEYSSIRAAERHLHFMNVQGLYLGAPGSIPSHDWLSFCWDRFSIVKGFRSWPEATVPLIRHSPHDFMRTARQQVYNYGYRRLAVLLMRSEVLSDDEARLGALLGFQSLHSDAGLEIEWRMLAHGLPQRLPEEVIAWLHKYRPNAVLGFPGSICIQLQEAGFRIPRDFGYAAVIQDAAFASAYGVAGCDSRQDSFPARAVQILHRMVQVGDRGFLNEPIEMVVEPRWIDGPSLPPK